MVSEFKLDSNNISNLLIGGLLLGLISLFVIKNHFSVAECQIRFKDFCSKFLNLISANNSNEYSEYLSGREAIKLKNHPDFHYFRRTQFFSSLTYGTEDIKVPVDASYGLCAILTANYSKIRGYVTHSAFLSDSRANLLRTYQIPDEAQLDLTLLSMQDLMARHQNITDYSPENLSTMLSFMKLYLLYLLSLEDPDSARNLNVDDFYKFKAPQSEYSQQPASNPAFKSQNTDRLYPQLPIEDFQSSYPINNNLFQGYSQPPAPGFRPEFLL